jgi:Flp pilus assembly protein TadG
MDKRAVRTAKVFGRDEHGASAVLFALMLPVIGAMAAMGVDTVHAYTTHEKLRTAAEAAATAALHALPDVAEARRLALLFGEHNRPEGAGGAVISSAEIEVGHWNAATKTFETDPGKTLNAARVTASLTAAKENPLRNWFGGLVGTSAFDVAVSATAVLQPGSACVITLDKSGAKALSLDSNAKIDSPKCEVHSNSTAADSLYAKSNAKVTSKKVCVEGGYVALSNASIQPTPQTSCNATEDPFAHVPPPAYGGCNHTNKVIDNKTATLQPGVYCGGLHIKGNSNITFAPGEYIIKDGNFSGDSNTKLNGTGVGFYLTGASALLDFSSNTEMSFTAPTSGPLAGFIFYQDRNFGGTHNVDSNVAAKLDGAVYFPQGTLQSKSNSTWGTSSSCLMIVANRMHFDSNAGVKMDADFSKCPWMQDRNKRSRLVG